MGFAFNNVPEGVRVAPFANYPKCEGRGTTRHPDKISLQDHGGGQGSPA
jgi:hypothetical protein